MVSINYVGIELSVVFYDILLNRISKFQADCPPGIGQIQWLQNCSTGMTLAFRIEVPRIVKSVMFSQAALILSFLE